VAILRFRMKTRACGASLFLSVDLGYTPRRYKTVINVENKLDNTDLKVYNARLQI